MNKSKFEYQKFHRYFAQATEGLEALCESEIKAFGAQKVNAVHKGVYFEATKEQFYRINYQTRYCSRILAPLISFNCHSTKYLYTQAQNIDWTTLFSTQNTISISASTANSKIKHSKYAAQCLKDAIVDQFREKFNDRPSVDAKAADITLHLRVFKNKAIISWDTSGGSLHKRGYKSESVEAPMKEFLAAAMIGFSKWDGKKKLYDPMCGSGTILCEAMLRYCRIPSGFFKEKFGLIFLPDFDSCLWKQVKEEASKNSRELIDNIIAGSDIEDAHVAIANQNLKNIKPKHKIQLKTCDFRKIKNLDNSIIVCNPPYGVRLESKQKVKTLYQEFGTFLKNRCKKSTAFIYVGEEDMVKEFGLKPRWIKKIKNGDLDGRLIRIDIF